MPPAVALLVGPPEETDPGTKLETIDGLALAIGDLVTGLGTPDVAGDRDAGDGVAPEHSGKDGGDVVM